MLSYIYIVGTHLNCTDKLMQFKWVPTTYAFIYMLWVLIWIVLTSWCNSNELQQHTLSYICCGYSFELYWQVDAVQMDTNNIRFYIYVVGTHLNCTDNLMQFKLVPAKFPFIYMLWVLIWIALTSWCISNGYQQHTFYMLWVLIWIALTSWCISNGYQQHTLLYMLWVLIWIAMTSWCISNGYQQHTLLYICCGYSFELQWQVNAIQMGTNNICLYKEVDKWDTSCNLKNTELLDCVG